MEIMITVQDIQYYHGPVFMKSVSYLHLSPHAALTPYISNYTITDPSVMADQYTILPTASSTLTYSITDKSIIGGLRGVNTKSSVVGSVANRFKLMLLIEFHPGGLYPLIGIPQNELLNTSFLFEELYRPLHNQINEAVEKANSVQILKDYLDHIFLSAFLDREFHPQLSLAMEKIHQHKGNIGRKELSEITNYSEKHLSRIFKQHLGTGIKTYSRIVRINHTIHLLQDTQDTLLDTAAKAGYYDQAHFIREFKELCGITPRLYLKKMSLFYNDQFKM